MPPLTTAVPPDSSALTVLDLFAGCGGLTEGMHQGSSRFRTVRAVEMDIEAAASYSANFGDVVYSGGIEQWLEDETTPEVDIVVGGPPCQGFSTLGKQDVTDERNELWRQYAKTVERARPSAFVMENVPAFVRSPQYGVFAHAFEPGGELADYTFETRILDASQYGVAQVRKRVVVLGFHKDCAHPGFPEPTHGASTLAADLGPVRTVRDAFEGLAPFAGQRELPYGTFKFGGRSLPGAFKASELHFGREYTDLSLSRFRAIPYGGGRFDLPEDLKADCWKRHHTGSGDVMGRLMWEKPSVTIRTEFFKPEKGRYLHPTQHRAITHHEAARIQGFRDDFLFVGSKAAIARQIGNAVPVQLGAVIGAHVAVALS